ncbi:MAG TPA: alpha/beta hydrolase [Candidatus Limnocylindrales bacterium]|nr:alpha/beta hydrolase [Candidatus Limnocylindrales bacterium]
MPRWAAMNPYSFLGDAYTIFLVTRKPGLPTGYTMRDMAADFAVLIRDTFGEPVDVTGISTGGSIALHLAADHPDVVRRLVIHSSAHTLSASAKALQLRVAALAQQGDWFGSYATLIRPVMPQGRLAGLFANPLSRLAALLLLAMAGQPKSPNDLVVTVEAEDHHAFRTRLGEIVAPTLVVAGDCDPFYTEALFRETAAGIPQAKLALYRAQGHPAAGPQFRRDMRAFLLGEH